jgi:DNA polymerase-3 subunit gamma/tau
VSYLVLARKYRPQTFEDLVGQEHVNRTITNAIATGRIAHAFLFTGVRGVGKTTSARLLAKCLNCVGPDGAGRAPTATPCNACAPCREITAGHDLDVQEIDGASYNGIDEVRRLQEGMSFRPARDRFKVYVVDEVHMLSTAAWNAFLKTLEEPPAHVKFIFATTEVHKIPSTILSRCQRYDFKLIATQTIARRLESVIRAEGIEADGAAVQVLARAAAGSMRDAMSLLDQVIAFSGNRLTSEDVTQVLGVADRKILHELATALTTGDAAACIEVVRRLADQGFDLAQVAQDISRHLRNLVVAKVCGDQPSEQPTLRDLLDLADEEVRDVVDLASRAETDDLSRLFQGFSRAYDEIVRSGQPRPALEMALVRLARRPALLPLDELLARVGDLERRLSGPPGPPPGTVPRGGGASGGNPGSRPAPSSPSPITSSPAGAEVRSARTVGALALAEPHPEPAEARAPPDPVPARAPSGNADDWRMILDRVRTLRPDIASVFEHAIPLEVGSSLVVVGFEPTASFLSARASDKDAIDAVRAAARDHFGAPTNVVIDTALKPLGVLRSVAAVDAERQRSAAATARAAVETHPVVREAIRLFDAQLRDVKLPSRG